MAKVRVVCPNPDCRRSGEVDEALLGKRGRCKKCGTSIVFAPSDGDSPAPSAAVSPVAGDQPEGDRVRSEDEVPTVWRPGDVILGLYEVKEVHEGGGMGLVYRVHHRGWNVDLAAKSPRPQFFATERHRENFEREAETWVNLGLHPHVVFCHYVRRLGGIPRVFAEYVAGGSLEQWIRSGRLYEGGPERALERILDIAIQLAWGLHHAHEQGLIHQDVKSANVMLTPEGLAKVTDFGLANARAESHEGGTPPPGQTLLASWGGMTPAYCSPEQAQIDHLRAAGVPRAEWPKLSRKTDLWSWAVTVLEMFVGEVAWGPGQLAGEWFSDGYPELDLEADLPRIPPGLSELMRRCFEREPQRRPGDMREVADTLKVLYEQVTHRPCSRPEPVAAMALADSLNNHAVSMLDLGKQDQAERLLEEALRADRNHVESTYNLGLIRWRTARTTDEVVLHQLREIGITAPGDWRIAYQIARIHLERDDCEAAVSTLEAISTPAAEREEIQAALTAGRDLLPMSRRCLYTLEGQTEEVISISLSGNGQSALSECDDNVARLRMMDIPRMDAGPVLQLLKEKMHRTLRLWAILLWVWALLLWEMIIGRRSHSDGYTAVVKAVSLSGDGRLALSISEDWTLRLWAVDTGRCLRSFEGFRWLVTSACLSYDGRLALTGGRDNKLRLWEVGSGRCLRSFVGHTGAVTSVCLSSDGRLALSGSSDETFRLWEADTGQCFRSFNGHMGLVTSVCLSGNVQLAMSGDLDHKLRLWEVNTGRCIRTFEGHTATLMSVCLSGNGRFALSADRNNKLRLWEVDTGRCLRSFEEPVNSFCLSQDG
ncbi:MAG TPA: protein kinase, partial [Isosphaeraceae bacterium]